MASSVASGAAAGNGAPASSAPKGRRASLVDEHVKGFGKTTVQKPRRRRLLSVEERGKRSLKDKFKGWTESEIYTVAVGGQTLWQTLVEDLRLHDEDLVAKPLGAWYYRELKQQFVGTQNPPSSCRPPTCRSLSRLLSMPLRWLFTWAIARSSLYWIGSLPDRR